MPPDNASPESADEPAVIVTYGYEGRLMRHESVIGVKASEPEQPISCGVEPLAFSYPLGAAAVDVVSHLIPLAAAQNYSAHRSHLTLTQLYKCIRATHQPPLVARTLPLVHFVVLAPELSPTIPFRFMLVLIRSRGRAGHAASTPVAKKARSSASF